MSEGRWKGETVICVASGPSLTDEDCALAAASGNKIIAVNNSWQKVKAHVLYASDLAWWRRYAGEIKTEAERWTNCRSAAKTYGCTLYRGAVGCHSGLAAIYLAAWFGAVKILLLGYDCQPTGGLLHWHGAHGRCRNPNELSFRMWAKQYRTMPRPIVSRVVNCSRETAIKVFARQALEQALAPPCIALQG